MFCPYCGKEISDGAKFCSKCGKAVRGQQGDGVKIDKPKENIEHVEESKGGSIPSSDIAEKKKFEWNDKYSIFAIIGAMVLCGLIGFGVRIIRDSKEGKEAESVAVYADEGAATGWEMEGALGAETRETGLASAEDAQGETMDMGQLSEPYAGEDMESPEEEEQLVGDYDPLEGGIHTYSYIVDDCSWSQAFVEAKNMGGYLAHINSAEEYEHILNEIEAMGLGNIQFMIGGRRDLDGDSYYWVDENNELYGEKLNDSSYWADWVWMGNEPSFMDGEIQESYMDMYYYAKENRWGWNDVPDDIIEIVPYFSGRIGYIVEYDE